MGERIQEMRKDWKRRIGGMNSGDILTAVSKLKVDRERRRNPIELAPKVPPRSPRIVLAHNSYQPVGEGFVPIFRPPSPSSSDKLGDTEVDISSIQSSIGNENSITEIIELYECASDTLESPKDTSASEEQNPGGTNSTTQSDTELPDETSLTREIALLERPVSERDSFGHSLKNREKSVVSCERSRFSSNPRLSRRELMRPLPEPPRLFSSKEENDKIQSLREELVGKAKELHEEKLKLQKEIQNIKDAYKQRSGKPDLPDLEQIDPKLYKHLRWVEHESHRLRVENGIMNKQMQLKQVLESENKGLRDKNQGLAEELSRLEELHRRVDSLEFSTKHAWLDEFDDNNALQIYSKGKQSSQEELERENKELKQQVVDLKFQLKSSNEQLQNNWDEERLELYDQVKILEASEAQLKERIEEEIKRRKISEEASLQSESSYNALSDSLKQQRERFQYQLQAIESKLADIESTTSSSFREDLSESIHAQKDLWQSHRKLFTLQEHYMDVLDRIHRSVVSSPEESSIQGTKVHEALDVIRQFLPQTGGRATGQSEQE